jgi:hypothetical protein
MEPRLSLVTLGVEDLARARQFYAEGLGLPLSAQSSDDVTFFELPGVWLGLYPRTALAEDVGTPAQGSGFRGFTLAHNVRTKAEVDAVLAEAVAAGATLVKPAQEVFWGGYSGYFADLDGFLWEVAHNPFLAVE